MTSVYGAIEDLNGTLAAGMEAGARETWERLACLVATMTGKS